MGPAYLRKCTAPGQARMQTRAAACAWGRPSAAAAPGVPLVPRGGPHNASLAASRARVPTADARTKNTHLGACSGACPTPGSMLSGYQAWRAATNSTSVPTGTNTAIAIATATLASAIIRSGGKPASGCSITRAAAASSRAVAKAQGLIGGSLVTKNKGRGKPQLGSRPSQRHCTAIATPSQRRPAALQNAQAPSPKPGPTSGWAAAAHVLRLACAAWRAGQAPIQVRAAPTFNAASAAGPQGPQGQP